MPPPAAVLIRGNLYESEMKRIGGHSGKALQLRKTIRALYAGVLLCLVLPCVIYNNLIRSDPFGYGPIVRDTTGNFLLLSEVLAGTLANAFTLYPLF